MKLSWISIYVYFGQLCVLTTSADPYSDSTKTLDLLFNAGRYDKRLRPFLQGPPVNVTVDISVVSIGGINELHMDFSVDMFFRQEWNDPRLAHNLSNPLVLGEELKNLIWIPDTFFHNVRTAKLHRVPSPNSRVLLSPNGNIEYSTRITLTASCLMDFRNYPLDTQICGLEMESYSYDKNNVDYFWKNDKQLTVMKKEMPEFELRSSHKNKEFADYPAGIYTNLSLTFTFHRRVGYSLMQIYAPTFLIVCLSWLSFWVSKDAVPARVALGVTTVLTIVTLMASFRNSVPKVSYIKALDWYLIFSFILVFGSVLEYVAVILQGDIKTWRKQNHFIVSPSMELNSLNQGEQLTGNHDNNNPPQSTSRRSNETKNLKLLPSLEANASTIDKASRILFPTVYFIFNISYWSIYRTDN